MLRKNALKGGSKNGLLQAQWMANHCSPDPHVVQIEKTSDSPICWADVVRSSVYDVELQADGKYHVRIEKDNAVLELSKADYDFIGTTIPRQLADPHSYSGDLALEINAAQLAFDRISHWQDIVGQLSHTTKGVLGELTARLEFLKGKLSTLETHVGGLRYNATIEKGSPAESRRTDTPSSLSRSKKRKVKGGPGLPWSQDETEKLPGWFKDHRHLPKEALEDEYHAFSGKERSFSSLQSQLYKLGWGELTNRKEGTSLKRKAPGEVPVATNRSGCGSSLASTDPAEVSKAMKMISGSTSNKGNPDPETRKEKSPPPRPAQRFSTPEDVDISTRLTGQFEFVDAEGTRQHQCNANDGNDRPGRTSELNSSHEEPCAMLNELQIPYLRSDGQSSNDVVSTESLEALPDVSISAPHPLTTSTASISMPQIDTLRPSTDGEHNSSFPENHIVTQASVVGHEAELAKERASMSGRYNHGWKTINQAGQADKDDSATRHPSGGEPHGGANHQENAGVAVLGYQQLLMTSSSTGHEVEWTREKPKRVVKSRTKTGCITCRRKRKKCDEKKPSCNNCLRSGSLCEGYNAAKPERMSVASGTETPMQSTSQRLAKISPKRGDSSFSQDPSHGQNHSNEPARKVSSVGRPSVQQHTQASGMGILPDPVQTLNLESLSKSASKSSQKQTLPNERVLVGAQSTPRYHNHTIPPTQHLLRDLDSGRDMGSISRTMEEQHEP
ncbi:hypothetical protein N7478_003726 [Penicillium angulare]|uniref:uncharacterized protein n=1 Tax=Penicillium angulare TaxID=116970 RepID=UPI00254177FE|nr:uncharacterized protein N7478_003726 [Penicillium angulare]KAJ5288040.1 hypothetical protein N7478_003726 [Penicillium angulare]